MGADTPRRSEAECRVLGVHREVRLRSSSPGVRCASLSAAAEDQLPAPASYRLLATPRLEHIEEVWAAVHGLCVEEAAALTTDGGLRLEMTPQALLDGCHIFRLRQHCPSCGIEVVDPLMIDMWVPQLLEPA